MKLLVLLLVCLVCAHALITCNECGGTHVHVEGTTISTLAYCGGGGYTQNTDGTTTYHERDKCNTCTGSYQCLDCGHHGHYSEKC